MNADWVIAIGIFVLFMSITLSLYAQQFEQPTISAEDSLESIKDAILEYLLVDVIEVPLFYNATNATPNQVMQFTYFWLYAKNTTRIYHGDSLLECQIQGNTVSFRATTDVGENYYMMRYAEKNGSHCTDSFSLANVTGIQVFSEKRTKMVLDTKITELNTTDYDSLKSTLGISNDFRIEINASGNFTTAGPPLPSTTSVFVRSTEALLEPGLNQTEIRIFTW